MNIVEVLVSAFLIACSCMPQSARNCSYQCPHPDIRIFGYSEIRKSGNLKIRISEMWEDTKIRIFSVFRFSVVVENRKIQTSGEKASDVEIAYVASPLKGIVIG